MRRIVYLLVVMFQTMCFAMSSCLSGCTEYSPRQSSRETLEFRIVTTLNKHHTMTVPKIDRILADVDRELPASAGGTTVVEETSSILSLTVPPPQGCRVVGVKDEEGEITAWFPSHVYEERFGASPSVRE